MSNLLQHQTCLTFVQNYIRLLRRLTHNSIATKNFYTITKHVLVLNKSFDSRFFYFSSIYYSSCDFDNFSIYSKSIQD